MFKRTHWVMAGLFIPLVFGSASAEWKKAVLAEYQSGCFLRTRSLLRQEMEKAFPDPEAGSYLLTMDAWIGDQLDEPWINYSDRVYYLGYAAFRDGNMGAARNHWRKYAALAGIGFGPDKPRLEEVNDYYRRTAPLPEVQKTESPEPPSVEKPKKTSLKKKVQKSRRRPADKTKEAGKNEVSKQKEQELLNRAEKAYETGQWDYAYRLFRLAKQANPHSNLATTRLTELEKILR